MNKTDPRRGSATRDSDARMKAEMAARVRRISYGLLGLAVILIVGLGHAQLGRSADYVALEKKQQLRHVILPAPRGVITDRKGRVLAGNRTRTALVLDLAALRVEIEQKRVSLVSRAKASAEAGPHSSADLAAVARLAVVQRHLARINSVLNRPIPLDPGRLERHFARPGATAFELVSELSADEVAQLTTTLQRSDPLQIRQSIERTYPHKHSAAHVLGRVRRELIRTPKGKDFPILNYFDFRGDSGVEEQHDAHLQGSPGDAIIQVDAFGAAVGEPVERHEPKPADNLVLSLDLDLQVAAERALSAANRGSRGAAVAISVTTGEVLVMASKPDFDLNSVSPALSLERKAQIDADGAWLNRATQGLYAPGSSFKIFTALAGLRRGTLQPEATFHCRGFYEVNGHRFPCHVADGHGSLPLRMALAQSCNVFAYQTGYDATAEALVAEARRFHFHEPTGIDLPHETQRMLVADSAWKDLNGKGTWTIGDTLHLAIGQGFLRYTPLQAACAMASLARRETLTVPTLLHQPTRRPTGDRAPEPLDLDEDDYTALLEGLRAVVEIGIGRDAQVPGISIAGKTGTAQVMRREGMMNTAWFVAFAPIERPEIAVAVALEGDEPGVEFAGAQHAAPVVREIIGAYFDQHRR
jgi:penicillin-binding protein 2